jgi:ABC-type uncharacterized transport system substrate-binding protein
MSVSPDYETIGGQAALIAQQVLDGKVSPASIPPAPPVGTQITLNLDTARMLDLLIDPLVLAFADEIIGEKPVPPTNVTRP